MVISAIRRIFGRGRLVSRTHGRRRLPFRNVRLEALEDRLAPAQVTWNCNDGNWDTPSCWSSGQLPTPDDDVVINRPGTVTVTNELSATSIRSLVNAEILLVGTTTAPSVFTLGAGASSNAAGAALRLVRTTVNGGGTLANSGTLEARGVSRIEVGFSNAAGATLIAFATNVPGGNNLTVAQGFTNSGTINLDSSGGVFLSALLVEQGTLTNQGTISARPSPAGNRTLSATVANFGLIEVEQDLGFDNVDRTFTNTGGVIRVATGRTLAIKGGPDGMSTVVVDGTTLEGGGTIDLGGSSINPGMITTNLRLLSSLTLPLNGPRLTFSGDVEVTGTGQFINQGTFEMSADRFADSVEVVNFGTFIVLGGADPARPNLTNEIRGTFTSQPNSTLSVRASRTDFDARLVVANGFTNNGTVQLTALQSLRGVRLEVLSGPLVNAAGRTFEVIGDQQAGERVLVGSLENRGFLRMFREFTIENEGHIFTSEQSQSRIEFVIPAIDFTVRGGDSVLGGSLDLLSGTPTNRLGLDGVHTMRIAGSQFVLRSDGPQLVLPGRVTINNTNGVGTLISQIRLNLTGDTINAILEYQAEVRAWGTNNQLNGVLQVSGQGLLIIEGRDRGCGINPADRYYRANDCGDADLYIGQNFTNTRPLTLTSIEGDELNPYYAQLLMPANTTLFNDSDINIEFGDFGGGRYFDLELVNRSRLNVRPGAELSFGGTEGSVDADHVNAVTGTIQAQGSVVVHQAASFHNQGTLQISPAQTFVITQGRLENLNAGILTGGVFIIDRSQFSFPNANIVTNRSNIQLTGVESFICNFLSPTCDDSDNGLLNFAVNDQVSPTVFGYFEINNRAFDTQGDFTNQGELRVGSGATFSVSMANGTGDLTNFSGETLRGVGVYDIRGTFQFRGALIRTNGDGNVTNSPTIALQTANSKIVNEDGIDALNPNNVSVFETNNGTVIVQSGRNLEVNDFINNGIVQLGTGGRFTSGGGLYTQNSDAILRLQGGTFVASAGVILKNLRGARIEGGGAPPADGDIQCEAPNCLQNAGTIAPGSGNTLGVLTLKGDYVQNVDGVVGTLEITMTANGQNDRFVVEELSAGVGGTATLDGIVAMQPITNPPYMVMSGHAFDVIFFDAGSGAFDSITGPPGPYDPNYDDPTFVRIIKR